MVGSLLGQCNSRKYEYKILYNNPDTFYSDFGYSWEVRFKVSSETFVLSQNEWNI